MNKKQLGLVMAAALGLSAAPAGAAFITDWDYVATLQWVIADADIPGIGPVDGPEFTSTTGTQITNLDLLSWGAPGGDHTVTEENALDNRSGLQIDGSPAIGVVETNGDDAETTTLTHFNNPIDASYGTLSSASLLTTLTLTPTAGGDTEAFAVVFTTDFIETPNVGPLDGSECGFQSESRCDDIFVVANPGSLSGTFEVAGITYTANIVVEGLRELPAETCETALGEGKTECTGLTTRESQANLVQIGFNVTAPVPEPATVALLGLGLAGLGASVATRRRRRQE